MGLGMTRARKPAERRSLPQNRLGHITPFWTQDLFITKKRQKRRGRLGNERGRDGGAAHRVRVWVGSRTDKHREGSELKNDW
jgi:hypothetical protein